ncbi:MAG: phosphatase PAP2 family protein [Gammaproteobacteria bacterium]
MEHFALNQQLMQWLYAGPQPPHWEILLAMIIAKYLILIFPLILIYQCLRYRDQRALVFVIFIAILFSCGLSYVIGHFLPTARPFVDGVVNNYMKHGPDASFPSDHVIFASTVAFGFMLGHKFKLGFWLLIIGLLIGLSRIFLGIHYPLDIAGGLVLGFLSALICVKGLLTHFQKALL